jgi:uncharacterized protein YndB with AHSA1/START domain
VRMNDCATARNLGRMRGMETQPPNPGELEVVSTRVFAASRGRLFEAFRDRAQVAQWWGPKGFTCTVHEMDLRVGGKWRLTLHGPGGTDYENEKTFTEVVVPERVVFEHVQSVHNFTMALTFEEAESGARMTWRMRFVGEAGNDNLHAFITKANEENFDRLETFLKTADPKL